MRLFLVGIGVSLMFPSADTNLQQKLDEFKSQSELPAFGAAIVENGEIQVAASGVRKIGEVTPAMTDGWVMEENGWAKGNLLWHNGSNTFNYSILFLAPELDKAVIATTNFGNLQEAEKALDELFKVIRE